MNTAATITIAAIASLTPTVACIIAILFSRQDWRRTDDKLDALRADTNTLFKQMDRRFDEIKEASHKDALVIMSNMVALNERVAKVEALQGR